MKVVGLWGWFEERVGEQAMVSKGGGEQGCKPSRGRIPEACRGIFLVNYKLKKVVQGFTVLLQNTLLTF